MGIERWGNGLLAGAAGVFVAFGTAVSPAPPSTPPPAPAATGDQLALPRGARAETELAALRTRKSRTFALADGTRLAQVFAAPIHYADDDGRWRRIDSRLVDSPAPGYALRNRANDWTVDLPEQLEQRPVKVTDDAGRWASFQLRGASSEEASAAAAEARYESARPGVDVEYEVLAEGVKETLVLAGPDAPSSYAFSLDASPGVRPRLTRGGAIEFRDGRATRFAVPAPTVWDASGKLVDRARYELARSGAGWTLTVRVDARWLRAPGRRFPVSVDPYLTVGAARDCTLDSGSPTTSYCGMSTVEVGWSGHHDHNAVYDFDLTAQLPAGIKVLDTYLASYVLSQTTGAWKSLDMLTLTQPWTNSATWNKRDATTAWATPGGDAVAANSLVKNLDGSVTGRWQFWPFPQIMQSWVDRESEEHGLLLRDHAPRDTANTVAFASAEHPTASKRPYVTVRYWARTGIADHTFEVDDLADGSTSMVNVANGNLVIEANDVPLAAAGPQQSISRYYNSQADPGDPMGTFGDGRWQLSTDAYIFANGAGDGLYLDESGAHHLFEKRRGPGETGWDPAPNLDAEYSQGIGEQTLRFPDMEDLMVFDDAGRRVRDEDADGNVVTYTPGGLNSVGTVTDADGGVIEFTHNQHPLRGLKSIREPNGRLHQYAYTSQRLSRYTDPAGAQTKYHYNAAGLLWRIEDAPGHYTAQYAYDTLNRVTSVTFDVGTATQRVTTFSYQPPTAPCDPASDLGKTIVTAGGTPITYCYAPDLEITFDDAPGFEDDGELGPSSDEPFPELDECTVEPEYPDTYCGGDAVPPEDEGELSALAVPNRFWGIADDEPISLPEDQWTDMFADPRFTGLGSNLEFVRKIVPWNLVPDGQAEGAPLHGLYRQTLAWVDKVLAAEKTPLISFDACRGTYGYRAGPNDPVVPNTPCRGSRDEGNIGVPPSYWQYEQAMTAFLAHPSLGRVNEYTAWNEPNHGSQDNPDSPIWDEPYRAGFYWRILNRLCRATAPGFACRVAAGDFQDTRMKNVRYSLGGQLPGPNNPPVPANQNDREAGDRYSRWYWRWYLKGMGGQVARRDARIWAWHAYSDGRDAGRTGDRDWRRYTQFRIAVGRVNDDARVWATEQGVVLHQGTRLEAGRNLSKRYRGMRAYVRGADAFVEQPRIRRFYYYQWRGDRPVACHDSGLLNAPGGSYNGCNPVTLTSTTASRSRPLYRIFRRAVRTG
jgi:YD repeat-containing protein